MNNTVRSIRLAPLMLVAPLLLMLAGTAFALLTPQQELGKLLYFDANLSEPPGAQSCASCHDPLFGFAEPDSQFPVSQGADPSLFGGRNAPSASYAAFFPDFDPQRVIGGQFWDGRAANVAEQAKGPFLNPVEMANTGPEMVIGKIALAVYAPMFEELCGPDAFNPANVDVSYNCMAAAIGAYEGSDEVNAFSSKYDAWEAGLYTLTPAEENGRRLFNGSAKCSHCHPVKGSKLRPALGTDFAYHNLGLPKNLMIEQLIGAPQPVDNGVGVTVNDPRENGRFKSPHLRNVELTPPYMHNGVLVDLKQVVHFYNTRDAMPRVCGDSFDPGFGVDCWPPPEVPETVNNSFLGNLGLSDQEEDDIVEFLRTFTDGYLARP